MPHNLSRKEFFRHVGQGTVRLALQLWPALAVGESPPPSLPDPLLADLPLALLADEAQRLGLDPQGDPEELARAIRQRMQQQAG
jgi:hypothetical protein